MRKRIVRPIMAAASDLATVRALLGEAVEILRAVILDSIFRMDTALPTPARPTPREVAKRVRSLAIAREQLGKIASATPALRYKMALASLLRLACLGPSALVRRITERELNFAMARALTGAYVAD